MQYHYYNTLLNHKQNSKVPFRCLLNFLLIIHIFLKYLENLLKLMKQGQKNHLSKHYINVPNNHENHLLQKHQVIYSIYEYNSYLYLFHILLLVLLQYLLLLDIFQINQKFHYIIHFLYSHK